MASTLDQDKNLPRLIRRKNYDRIKDIINEGGGDLTSMYEGRTLLGLAAEVGYVPVVKLLLDEFMKRNNQIDYHQTSRKTKSRHNDNKRTSSKKLKNIETPKNVGYFTVVHTDGCLSCLQPTNNDNAESNRSMDHMLNESIPTDTDKTPDGMEALEWDTEIKDNNQQAPNENRDEMTALYRWYAKILDKAADMLNTPLPYDLNQSDSSGLAAIHHASIHGHVETLELLLKYGCRVNVMTDSGMTALHYGCQSRSIDVVRVLLDHGAYTDMAHRIEGTPLHIAVRVGDVAITELLINRRADVNVQAAKDMTPLHDAIQHGHVDCVELLIRNGARVNLEDAYGTSPLCEAVWFQEEEITRLLLLAGAKITQSHYLLHSAVFCNNIVIARLLLEAGSLPNLINNLGETAIFPAIRRGDTEMVQLLLEYGADINQLCLSGKGVIHDLVDSVEDKQIFKKMFYFLLDNGATTLKQNWYSQSAVYSAVNNGRIEIAHMLITCGLDMAYFDILRNESVLCLARRKNLLSICKLLVHIGFNIRHRLGDLKHLPDNSLYNLNEVNGWLSYHKYNPLSLSKICRIHIRLRIRHPLYKSIHSLPLPKHILSFLLMEYEDD